ncbi:MAG: fructose 1,6-bisphosphatase [Candidatus Rokubacteria bacterium]|nr:fructose 1,6-bisphosphatase [Candidatus Rokubacteria bacterium]MBI2155563.1 fructose 1,6-bisphosphatase [Candidatus Rokubacteria bacterium]MBI2491835.1 fructose 1,6-bisphosphatase [Candidatus Rokubacteria bacterium]MBI4255211.1 fructose 1,6-bisphosphatase [Candidatus Rokubacteria bacterium]
MAAKRYGLPDGKPVKLSEYHESRDELEGLPRTLAEKVPVTSTPNIFSYRSYVFAKNPALVQRYIKATKADVGGVGGHVVAADEVKSVIAKFVLENNWCGKEPMFTSLIVTHTGDDVAVTGIVAESVDMSLVDQLMWDALHEGARKAAELGLYGPGQDLVADAFTGNLRGTGPATVALPLPVRKDNASQTVLVSFADKTEPMAFNYYATGAYLLPRFNTGLVIAASKMKRGYLMEIVDLDTKAQAIEAGAHPRDQRALDGKMEELAKGLQEKVITLRAPEDLYDIEGLCRSSRFVIARIWSRGDKGERDQLGYVCSAERLHNIKTKKGFSYGGKDDPVLLAFAQGDWPAPGEMTSPWAACPMVAGDCRGSHNLHILPMPINSQTSYWSGPILSAITLSCNIHTGRIGAISDQFALGTPWDEVRRRASELAIQFRMAHGIRQPATLHEDELEYQEGWKERRTRLERQFELKPPLTFGGNGDGANGGKGGAKAGAGRRGGRPGEID